MKYLGVLIYYKIYSLFPSDKYPQLYDNRHPNSKSNQILRFE